MKWTRYWLLLPVLLVQALSSCSLIDEQEYDNNSSSTVSLAFTVSNATENKTRMSNDVVQAEGQSFRGMKGLLVIPFATDGGLVKAEDMPLISTVSGNNSNQVENENYYYFDKCSMTRGTNRVLVYGQAADIANKTALSLNGKLETNLVDRMLPNDITFSLSPIRKTTDVHPDAQALASYMTTIANTNGWSTTNNEQMKALYLDFINAQSEGNGLMSGSAAHVKAYVNALKQQIKNNTDELSTVILSKIDADAKSCLDNGYPSNPSTSLGLPDGAAALRWSDGKFSVRTTTTTLDNINNITRYTYPAELWYYANSGIHTSTDEVAKSDYQSETWENLLSNYYKGTRYINGDTRSVAVDEPLQYGVACLQMTLNKITASPLKDAKDQLVTYEASQFPLKAVIIGGQHTVGFDFKPKGEQSDVDARFIYDTVVGDPDSDGKYTVNTLVLQSYDGEKVPIILEFENKTGQKFAGKDGIIYPDTKFYLIAQVNPATGTVADESAKRRVFTRDYTTTMTMSVISLANAYSCMPDLLAPRLEIGVQVTTTWIQPTTTTVIL